MTIILSLVSGFIIGFIAQEYKYQKRWSCYQTRLDREISECEKMLKVVRKLNEK